MKIWILLLFIQIFIITIIECINIHILSKESAFIKYSNQSDLKEILYSQPLEDKINLTASYGSIKTTKELERSKYVSNIYTDNQILSIQSNLNKDHFTINSICKFDHDKLAAFALDKVCCEITIRNSKNPNKVIDQKYCKLEISHTSSACYSQMEISKEHFDFQKSDEFELEILSRVFSSQDSKCLRNSLVVDNLALGYPLKLLVTQGLQVKWEILESSESFGVLDIGVPVDSIETNSKTIFPLKLRSNNIFSNLEILCSFGTELSLSSLSFESTRYEGEFKTTPRNGVRIILAKKENFQDIGGELHEEQLVNLRIRHMNQRTYTPSQDKNYENWISCSINRKSIQKSNLEKTNESAKKVFIKINEDNFIIIPILPKAMFFSILNPIFGPITLKEKRLKILNVHSIRDGSFVDVTAKTECKAISNFSLTCPYDNENHKLYPIKDPDWNVILTMMSWRKMFKIPFDLWRAEDWRLIFSDKILNRLKNWNYPNRITNDCKPVYQTTMCRLLARLLKNVNTNNVYFGRSTSDEYPLLDMTPQLSESNIQLSNENIRFRLNDNVIQLLVNHYGTVDISIIDNQYQKIAFDLVNISDKSVSIVDIDVSCVHSLNINQSSNANHLPFRSIFVSSQPSRNINESCYFKIDLIFSDKTRTDLWHYKHTKFYLNLVHLSSSITIEDLSTFLYEPFKYNEPGKFHLQLYESKKCSKSKLLFQKKIDIFQREKRISQVLPTVKQNSADGFTTISSKTTNTENIFTITSGKTVAAGVDTEKLFLTMKILIGLVCVVAFIIILNCIIKIRHRKSACLLNRQLNNCQVYGQVEKLTTSTYSPVEIPNPNSSNQHPPLLPPPGPLYNPSDSSQLDLAVNATPDRFWDFSHAGDANLDRKMPSNHLHMGIQMNTLNGQGNSMNFPNIFSTSRRTSPSPHSDNIEYGYYNSGSTKLPHTRAMQTNQNGYNYPPNSLHDSDSLASGTGSKTSSQVAGVVPPCPPLRWNNNWNSHQFPVYFPNDKDTNNDPSISQFSHEHSDQNSLNTSHSSSWEIKQPLVLPPVGFNSVDNMCEKSSGLGSLTSTQPGSDCSKKESTHTDSPQATNFSTSH